MTQYRSPMHVFVLAGQSNMAGRGGVHGLPDGGKAWDQEQPCLHAPGRTPSFIEELPALLFLPSA